MTQKPKLEPGQRVRVYQGHAVNDGIVIPLKENAPAYPGAVHIEFDAPDYDGNTVREYVHEKQCRKLRPKQKPEKERGRIRCRAEIVEGDRSWISAKFFDRGGSQLFPRDTRPAGMEPEGVCLTEMRQGEVVVKESELKALREFYEASN